MVFKSKKWLEMQRSEQIFQMEDLRSGKRMYIHIKHPTDEERLRAKQCIDRIMVKPNRKLEKTAKEIEATLNENGIYAKILGDPTSVL